MLKVPAMGSLHAKYFPHEKYRRAYESSTPPYNTHHTLRVMLLLIFWRGEKTCWLPAEPAIPSHNSGHLGDVLLITFDIYRMFIVYLELY